MWQETNIGTSEMSNKDNIRDEINKCIESIPTKPIENTVRPILHQIIALLRQRGCIDTNLPIKPVSIDQTIHVVSKTVTEVIQSGRKAANSAQNLKQELEHACDVVQSSGDTLCRFLTQKPRQGLSPSSSQTGTDSGVEDIDDEYGSEILRYLCKDGERNSVRNWILNESKTSSRRHNADSLLRSLSRDDASSTRSFSDDDIKKSELSSVCLSLMTSLVDVLILADQSAVQDVVTSVKKVANSLEQIEQSRDFHDFMAEFREFGNRLVTLAHETGSRQKELRRDTDRVHMEGSRSVLEKGTSLLLSTSKICFRHPNSCLARQCRNQCLERMKTALVRIENIVLLPVRDRQEEVTPSSTKRKLLKMNNSLTKQIAKCSIEKKTSFVEMNSGTAFQLMTQLQAEINRTSDERMTDDYDLTQRNAPSKFVQIENLVRKLLEIADDFTDCAYTRHEQRLQILEASTSIKSALNNWIKEREEKAAFQDALQDFTNSLQIAALVQLNEVNNKLKVRGTPNCDVINAIDQLISHVQIPGSRKKGSRQYFEKFREFTNEVFEAFSLARQCLSNPAGLVAAAHVIDSINYLNQQITTSYHIVQSLPDSTPAVEQLLDIIQRYKSTIASETVSIASSITKHNGEEIVSCSEGSSKIEESTKQIISSNTNDQADAVKLGLDIKLLSTQCRVEHSHWTSLPKIEQTTSLLRLVRKISASAWSVYHFTRGDPPLHTTADLFHCASELIADAEEFSRSSRRYLEEKEAAVRVPALYTDAISTALLIPVTCHRSQALISRMNATNKAAIFSKVIGTLQNVKKVLELVTKLAMSSHSVALKLTFLPSLSEHRAKSLVTPRRTLSRSGSATPRSRTRSQSRGRPVQCQCRMVKLNQKCTRPSEQKCERTTKNANKSTGQGSSRSARLLSRSQSLSHSQKMSKFLTCVKLSADD
ncbi:alpha-catulin-like isoform X2 [Clavelina lepadiformis]|uniref:alpha-catulin-like isoform X2 n=1 Tax=Clavelina lepadiformis TaxID=159417 RepID=UPI004041D4E2